MENIYIGTSGWSYQHWKGVFYPDNLSQKKLFPYYCQYFDSVEVNATFYRWFKESTYLNWREKAPHGFKYVLKAPKLITHFRRLKDCNKEIKDFYTSANLLKENFGLILLQLPPNLNYDLMLLKDTLKQFEDPAKIAIEFRNETWIRKETFALLSEFKATYCIVDSPKLNDLIRFQEFAFSNEHDMIYPGPSYPVTSITAYIRLHGRTKWFDYNYSEQELNDLARIVEFIIKKGIENIYIFFNNDTAAYAVFNGLYLKKQISQIL